MACSSHQAASTDFILRTSFLIQYDVHHAQNLQKCESLERLDLTINFVPKAGLLTLESLAGNDHLRELTLMGNPCTDWPGYREYVIAKLPQLEKLDGQVNNTLHTLLRLHRRT